MNRKLHNPKSQAPAVYIPNWLIQVPAKKISHGAKILYGRLSQWSNETGEVYRSQKDLMEEIGVGLRMLGNLIKELKDIGLIDTVQPIKGGISHYIFYDHEWMHESIKKQLVYKNNENNPMQDTTYPNAESCMTPMQNPAYININKIKINNNTKNTIVDSEESPEVDYTESDDLEISPKSDYHGNHEECLQDDAQPFESKREQEKSDYFDYQSNYNTVCKTHDPNNAKSYNEDALFMQFYSQYPNKQKPTLAYKAFLKLKPTPEFVAMITADVHIRLENNWKNRHKSKISHPATYLNSREWEGEIFPPDNVTQFPNKPPRYTMSELMGDDL